MLQVSIERHKDRERLMGMLSYLLVCVACSYDLRLIGHWCKYYVGLVIQYDYLCEASGLYNKNNIFD